MSAPAIVDTPEEAAGLDLEPLIVRRPLERFLDEQGLGSGPVEAEPIGEGHSNITFLIRREDEAWVLRRPPRGPLPPSAHDVIREHRLLAALGPTEVRTPAVVAACDDESVIGAPFYVMEVVEGDVITFVVPDRFADPGSRARIAEELIDALVEMHAADWRACGLEGFGKPTGYLERQLRRFSGMWPYVKTREVPHVEEVGQWLADNLPDSPEATIVHGDYRLGNTMFAPGTPPRLAAIFDWEMSTIGDPLADVGYFTATYSQRGDPVLTSFDLMPVTREEGFPTRDELVALYEERSGRRVTALRWYQTLAIWKATVFMEGNYKRALAGTTDDPYLKGFKQGVLDLAEQAWQIAQSA